MAAASGTPAALFFDIDGTLVWHDLGKPTGESVVRAVPSPAVADAFRRLRERGHQTFICTGRAPAMVSPAIRALEPTGIVAAAGACVVLGSELVYERTIPRDVLEDVVARFEAARIPVVFEGPQACVVFSPGHVENPIAMPGAPEVYSARELAAAAPMRYCKFSFKGDAIHQVEQLDDVLLKHFTRFNLGHSVYEMCLTGVNKGDGVRHALELIGHGPENTFGFGDSENDLPMLGAVETSVAMGNALPQVKAVASYVTTAVQDDGVPHALEHFGLI